MQSMTSHLYQRENTNYTHFELYFIILFYDREELLD